MKRIIHLLTGLMILLVVVASALWLIHLASRPDCWTEYIAALQAERGWGMLAGIVLLVLVSVYALTAGRAKVDGEQYLSFKNNGATVSILLRAVTEFIAKIGDEFAAIVSMKPSIRPRAASIDIDLDIRVKAGTQIPELCQLLQERVRESMKVNLGLTEIKRIRVQVKDIVGEAPPLDEVREQIEA